MIRPISRKEQQDKMQGYFYEMLYGVMNAAWWNHTLSICLPEWQQWMKRGTVSAAQHGCARVWPNIPAPMLLQLDVFSECVRRGLEMTTSGSLVYLGSVLLVLGHGIDALCARKSSGYCFQTATTCHVFGPQRTGFAEGISKHVDIRNGSARTWIMTEHYKPWTRAADLKFWSAIWILGLGICRAGFCRLRFGTDLFRMAIIYETVMLCALGIAAFLLVFQTDALVCSLPHCLPMPPSVYMAATSTGRDFPVAVFPQQPVAIMR